MPIPPPGDPAATPVELNRELQELIGPEAVSRWCAAILGGTIPAGADQPSLAWFGRGAADLAQRGIEGDPGRAAWVRTWGARGLLHCWDEAAREVAVPAVTAALTDEAWRVREMAAKVIRRWRVAEASTALDDLQHDEVARVRTAAAKARAELLTGGARTSTSGDARPTSGHARTTVSGDARSSRAATRAKPITAPDFRRAARDAVRALEAGVDLDWSRPAANVSWTCAQTCAHISDDFIAFALQLAVQAPSGYLPFRFGAQRGTSPAGMIKLVEATAAVLVATAAAAPAGARAYHPYGLTGAEGFLALATAEVVVHTHDIAAGLGVPYEPPAALCRRILARLLPRAELRGEDPWAVLRWATGRLQLAERERVSRWHWQLNPPA